MKLTHLSLAVMVALGLAACGGSDSNHTQPDAQAQAKAAAAAKAKADAEAKAKKEQAEKEKRQKQEAQDQQKIIDPLDLKTVEQFNLRADSSLGTLQYITRGKASNFNQVENPHKMGTPATATLLLSVPPDQQNPEFTNITLAKNSKTKAEPREWWQYAGAFFNNPADKKSLQTENAKNVSLTDKTKRDGIVRMSANNRGELDTLTGRDDFNVIKGEVRNDNSTHIFGRYYLVGGANGVTPVKPNSYNGAVKVVATGNKNHNGKVTYQLDAIKSSLEDVQYGRVTSNLDKADAVIPQEGKGQKEKRYSQMVRRSHSKAIDTYFYRGTNSTTAAQIAALPKQGTLKYDGHAVMYGVDNRPRHLLQAKTIPTATSGLPPVAVGVGNFVTAYFKPGDRTVTGTVYNQWLLDDSNKQVVKDHIVGFNGNLFGNTILGKAYKLEGVVENPERVTSWKDNKESIKNDAADFRASFYGAQALEMGGSFNSSEVRREGRSYEKESWGGVFGAKRTIAPPKATPVKPKMDTNSPFGDAFR